MSVEDAFRFAKRIERSCSGVLDEGLVGMILHGSLVLGDYVPSRSDVDLLAIVGDSLTNAQRAAFIEAVTEERVRAPARVDLRVVARYVASAPTPSPLMEMYIAARPGVEGEVHVETDHPGRDLVVEFSICRAHGRSFAGPEPFDLIGEVPDEWVLDMGVAQIDEWQATDYSPRRRADGPYGLSGVALRGGASPLLQVCGRPLGTHG